MTTVLPPTVAAAKTAADEALARREKLAQEIVTASTTRKSIRDRYTDVKAQLERAENQLGRTDDINAISRAVSLRQMVQSFERELAAADEAFVELETRRTTVDEELSRAWQFLSGADAPYKVALVAELQAQLDDLTRGLVKVLARAHAISNARGHLLRTPLSEMQIADFVSRHKLNIPSQSEPIVTRISALNETYAKVGDDDRIMWRDIPADEVLQTLEQTLRKLTQEHQRIDAEREAREAADPVLKEQRERDRRELRDRENRERQQTQMEKNDRVRVEQSKLSQAYWAAHQNRETRLPGTPAPARLAHTGAVQAAGESAERLATGNGT